MIPSYRYALSCIGATLADLQSAARSALARARYQPGIVRMVPRDSQRGGPGQKRCGNCRQSRLSLASAAARLAVHDEECHGHGELPWALQPRILDLCPDQNESVADIGHQ